MVHKIIELMNDGSKWLNLEYKITNHGEILITKKHDNFANGLEVEWNYQGPWCEYITKTVNKLIQDTERNIQEEKKQLKNQELNSIKDNKDHFSNLFSK